MPEQVEARYTLFNSVAEMLSPEVLSSLISTPVSCVERRPMADHNGLAGGRFSYVDTDNGRYVLKRMSIDSDWLMYATDDQQGRSVRLWQYGLLDRLQPFLDHKIIACARDGGGWAILMHDLSGGLYSWEQPWTVDHLPLIIDTLARLHATFWNDPILNDQRIGLCDSARILDGTSLPVARKRPVPNEFNSPIAKWVEEGWEIMAALLDRDIFKELQKLTEDPRPLLAALDRYPFTLIHGDFRNANLAILSSSCLVAFDWQFSARSLMSIGLAWFAEDLDLFSYEDSEAMSRAQIDAFYRQRLETYLQQRFDDQDWEAMIDLGNLVEALRRACISAFFSRHGDNPEWRKSARATAVNKVQQAHKALRWL